MLDQAFLLLLNVNHLVQTVELGEAVCDDRADDLPWIRQCFRRSAGIRERVSSVRYCKGHQHLSCNETGHSAYRLHLSMAWLSMPSYRTMSTEERHELSGHITCHHLSMKRKADNHRSIYETHGHLIYLRIHSGEMHQHLNIQNKVGHGSQENVVGNCEIEPQSTRFERNQHDLGVLAVEGRTIESLLYGGNSSRLAFTFLLLILRLTLLDAGRDVFVKVIVGIISGDKV